MGKTKVSIEDARAWLHRRLTAIPQSGCPENRAKLRARENEPARGSYSLQDFLPAKFLRWEQSFVACPASVADLGPPGSGCDHLAAQQLPDSKDHGSSVNIMEESPRNR